MWGAGIEWRFAENIRVIGDYDRVQYAQLKEDFINIQAISSGRESQLRIDNGNEIHAGLEYLFLGAPKPLAFRGGVRGSISTTPVHYVPTAQGDTLDVRLAAALPGGKNLLHGTLGAGVALSRWLELNATADLSSRTTYATASAVVRF